MKRRDRKDIIPIYHLVLLTGIAGAMLTLSACTGGGGGGGLAGAATIRGTVAEFNGLGVAWFPAEPKSAPAALAAAIVDLVVPSAHAAVDGVTVRVAGTDLVTTTGEDGFFIIGGVPPGLDVSLIFSRDNRNAVFTLDVPRGSEIDLRDVRVIDDVVEVAEIAVTVSEEEVEDDGTNLDLDGDGRPEIVTVIPNPGGRNEGSVAPVEPKPSGNNEDDNDPPGNTVAVGREDPAADPGNSSGEVSPGEVPPEEVVPDESEGSPGNFAVP